VSDSTQSGHDAKVLFKPNGKELYLRRDYEAEFEKMPAELCLKGGAFLEALSVCHVGQSGPEYSASCLEEAAFAAEQLNDDSYVLVPSCALQQPDVEEMLRNMSVLSPRVRGIRQILNHEPNWPRNGVLGNLLENPAWIRGFQALAGAGLSFDMQLNPRQYAKAVEVVVANPEVIVIINHLGCPLLEDLQDGGEVYWAGMEAFAKLPNTYIKLSMLCYPDPNWDENELVLSALHRVIELFGPHRCMFASNFPVDVKDGWPAERLLPAFLKLAERYSEGERQELFAGSARRAYRCQV
ncbi:unnamed protein product, partial [Polarella glacialis]